MELWQAALFGLVQGVTEFLPVSSSGHLRVIEHFTGLAEPQTVFDLSLHVATLAAVLIIFRGDLWDMVISPIRSIRYLAHGRGLRCIADDSGVRGAVFIILGSVPTAFLGFKLGPYLESRAASLEFVACMFLVNTAILLGSRWVVLPTPARRLNSGFSGMNILDALLIGTAQGFSVARGVSRSGTTISFALMLGVDRETAGKFSFLLAIPAIAGATLYSALGADLGPVPEVWPLVVGGLAAFFSGLISLQLLMSVVKKGKLHAFAPYTLLLGAGLLFWIYYGHRLSFGG